MVADSSEGGLFCKSIFIISGLVVMDVMDVWMYG